MKLRFGHALSCAAAGALLAIRAGIVHAEFPDREIAMIVNAGADDERFKREIAGALGRRVSCDLSIGCSLGTDSRKLMDANRYQQSEEVPDERP